MLAGLGLLLLATRELDDGMRKPIIRVIVITAAAFALLLVALLTWMTYKHYHQRAYAGLAVVTSPTAPVWPGMPS